MTRVKQPKALTRDSRESTDMVWSWGLGLILGRKGAADIARACTEHALITFESAQGFIDDHVDLSAEDRKLIGADLAVLTAGLKPGSVCPGVAWCLEREAAELHQVCQAFERLEGRTTADWSPALRTIWGTVRELAVAGPSSSSEGLRALKALAQEPGMRDLPMVLMVESWLKQQVPAEPESVIDTSFRAALGLAEGGGGLRLWLLHRTAWLQWHHGVPGALSTLERCLRVQRDAGTLMLLASALRGAGREEEAAVAAEESLCLQPLNLGQILLGQPTDRRREGRRQNILTTACLRAVAANGAERMTAALADHENVRKLTARAATLANTQLPVDLRPPEVPAGHLRSHLEATCLVAVGHSMLSLSRKKLEEATQEAETRERACDQRLAAVRAEREMGAHQLERAVAAALSSAYSATSAERAMVEALYRKARLLLNVGFACAAVGFMAGFILMGMRLAPLNPTLMVGALGLAASPAFFGFLTQNQAAKRARALERRQHEVEEQARKQARAEMEALEERLANTVRVTEAEKRAASELIRRLRQGLDSLYQPLAEAEAA